MEKLGYNPMSTMRFLVYDVEIFQRDWCLVARDPFDPEPGNFYVIVNDREALIDLINSRLQDTIFVGYNNRHYDDYILRYLYHGLGENPIEINNHIIADKQFGHTFEGMRRA